MLGTIIATTSLAFDCGAKTEAKNRDHLHSSSHICTSMTIHETRTWPHEPKHLIYAQTNAHPATQKTRLKAIRTPRRMHKKCVALLVFRCFRTCRRFWVYVTKSFFRARLLNRNCCDLIRYSQKLPSLGYAWQSPRVAHGWILNVS